MSLLLSKTGDERYNRKRHLRCNETKPVIARHRFVLELHLAGHRIKKSLPGKPSIEELTGYSAVYISSILRSPKVQALKQQIMSLYDEEFKMLYPKVVKSIQDGLSDACDMPTRLSASKLWLKAHGKLQKDDTQNTGMNVTAEDVVIQILNQNNQDTQGN